MSQAKQAIVIGGSMAGLLAAQVLSQHFQQVTVIERDRLPEHPEHRQGVPQSHHVHVLLTQGYRILEQLFPGMDAELAVAGAPQVEWTYDTQLLSLSGWAPPVHSDLVTRPCSRTLLEWVIRHRLYANERIKWLPQSQVVNLLTNDDQTVVTGVRVRHDEQAYDLDADLVVDASGRHSHTPDWLEKMGYAAPEETVINSFLGYASRCYQMPTEQNSDWKVLMIAAKPPHHSRGAVLYPVENQQFILTLAGVGRDYPSTDEAGFLEFARSLRSPLIYEAIKDAQPLSDIYAYRRTENRLRHYDKLTRFPDRFVVLGDAVCAFNPIYGQGMTTAALGAMTLDDCLKQAQVGQAQVGQVQKRLGQVITAPWLMATSEDFRWSTTEGGKPDWLTRGMHRYFDRVIDLTVEQGEIYKVFAEVIHMIKSPDVLFRPGILFQVLKRSIALLAATNT